MSYLLVAGFSLLIWIILWIVYTYLLSPLSAIPNASFLAPLSSLAWKFPTEHNGKITLELPELHKKLGPLVRIGPTQVSFYSLEIYKAVHAPGSAFVKDPQVYSQFVQDGYPALFSITDPKDHTQRRRNMGVVFNRSKVPALTSMMYEEISKFCYIMYKLNQKGRIDLIPTCRALEADIVSRFAFGTAIGAVDTLQESRELLDIIHNNDSKSCTMPISVNFPRATVIWSSLEKLCYQLFGWESRSTSISNKFDQWADENSKRYGNGEKGETSFINTMTRVQIPFQAALSEAKEMLGPGTDTTSATLAHILWALSLNQSFQAELVSDLATAGWPIDMAQFEAIPRLVACVKEGIRWTGAAAAMWPRVVPRGGTRLGGKFLPGGTIVSSSPIWYLRDEIAFPEPWSYRPSRWLTDKSYPLNSLRDDYYIPFSKGPSTCIGIHFSYLELYLSVSQVLKNYCLKPGEYSFASTDIEATLPPRREWVAAVPTTTLAINLQKRDS